MARGGKQPGAGRPKGSKTRTTAEMRSRCRMYTDRALDVLERIAEKSKNESNKMSAVKEILDRGHGKAAQVLAGDPDNPVQTRVVMAWDTEPIPEPPRSAEEPPAEKTEQDPD